MPSCIIDGKTCEFQAGENLIEIAKRNGIEIPYFCYHPGMSVVAQCRMCAVEVEKSPKLQTACSMSPQDGMVVHTQSEKTKSNQASVMEFLLINHPLDCPICDKSGECDLQDYSYDYGDSYARYTEERRTYLDLDMGPVIKKNMNRCIHCTRCIRFADEIAGIREMVAVQRGNNTEITTVDGKPLETEYAGNYADICPTGSLTLKEFRFKKRVWYLQKTPTVCEACSRGCNIELHHEKGVIYRTVPRENMQINKHWICDEGRFHFREFMSETRVLTPVRTSSQGLSELDWNVAVESAKQTATAKKTVFLIGTDLTLEEAQAIQSFVSSRMGGAQVYHFGTPKVSTALEDSDADRILKRKSRTSNLHGLEKMGISPIPSSLSGFEVAVVFSGGRAVVPPLSGMQVIGVGVFDRLEAEKMHLVLPGPSAAEKSGTIQNFQGTQQKLQAAIPLRGACKPIPEILMMWANQKGDRANAGLALAGALNGHA